MSASPSAVPASSGGAADPSMEDILASIRRILSEDEADSAPAPEPPAHAAPPPPAAPEVLALDASMLVEPPEERPAPPPPAPPPAPPVTIALPPPAPAALPESPPPPADMPTMPMPEPLLGAAAAAAATSSVGSLLRTLVTERAQVSVYRGGPTIEDMVREEVRPLLKDWLDNNLPPLVERLVRAEIERLVGRSLT